MFMLGDSDPLVWTPTAIDTLRNQVGTEIDDISRTVTDAWVNGKIDNATRAPFKAFYDEWAAYRDQTGIWNAFWSIWGAEVDRIKSFQVRALEWRQQLKSLGYTFYTPEPHVTPPAFNFLDYAPYVKWGLVIGVGLIAFPYVKPILDTATSYIKKK